MSSTAPAEQVVLLDEAGAAVGTADKAGVHHATTPLHLAFSCYVFDAASWGHRLLLTRRALHKRTFPGVWTNTCCGHPAPGEPLADAVRRRVRQELGLELDDLRLLLPRFRYRAEMAGVVENEMCPVFAAATSGPVRADPDEVDDAAWVRWSSFRAEALAGTRPVSPWCVEQLRELPSEPWSAPAAPDAELPPAAGGHR